MKVLMLASSVDTSRGPDGFIADWVRALGKKVDRLTVLAYNYNQQEKLPANIRVIKINGKNFLTRNVDLIFKVFKYSKENDVIFAHILEVFGIVAGITGKLLEKKSFLWYCQGYDLSKHWMAKIALVLVDKIFTSTEEIKERYIKEVGKSIKNKIIIVGHGINLAHYD